MLPRHPAVFALALLLPVISRAVTLSVSTRDLARRDPLFADGFTASPDAAHLAWVEGDAAGRHAVLDATPGATYGAVKNLVFSEDGNHLAYLALAPATPELASSWTVVLDGREHGRYDHVGRPVLDRDAGLLAFTARSGTDPLTIVVNGDHPLPRDTVVDGSVFVSREGKRWACVVKARDRYQVVSDGGRGPLMHAAPASVVFSPDGARLGYIAMALDRWFILDGREVAPLDEFVGPAFDSTGVGIGWALYSVDRWKLHVRLADTTINEESPYRVTGLVLSPDGRHYAATRTWPLGGTRVELDGRPVGEHAAVTGLRFRPDGNGLVYAGRDPGGWRVFAGGEASGLYSEVRDLTVSPDGAHWACWVPQTRGWHLVVDGARGPSCDEPLSPPVFESGSALRFIARHRDTYRLTRVTIAP